MSEQCIEFQFSLADLGCREDEWEPLSLRLLPPRTTDFDESVLSEVLSTGNPRLAAAALLFASEYERYMGRDDQILARLFRSVEILPDNIVTLTAIVDELEAFHRPQEALAFAERLGQIAQLDQSTNGRNRNTELWKLGQIRYLAGEKTEAIEYWRSIPLYQRANGEDQLKLWIDACERRLLQYAESARSKNS